MKKLLSLAAGLCILVACNNKPSDTAATASNDTASKAKDTPQSEFADARYTEIGKKRLQQLASGQMDAWVDGFADSAAYRWSSGDSLIGKTAIANYWKNRRMNVIDSLEFSNDIWLPLKVNRPQKGPDVAGTWLLGWYMVSVKYKNGKKLQFWVHNDEHFDKNDKVDLNVQYIDRAPIVKALGK
jgi:hypothetical protein